VDAGAFEQFLLDTQRQILAEAEQLDGSGKTFVQDRWERPGDNAGVGWEWVSQRQPGASQMHRVCCC
jgi:coproporphyrinogen III oxidase